MEADRRVPGESMKYYLTGVVASVIVIASGDVGWRLGVIVGSRSEERYARLGWWHCTWVANCLETCLARFNAMDSSGIGGPQFLVTTG